MCTNAYDAIKLKEYLETKWDPRINQMCKS